MKAKVFFPALFCLLAAFSTRAQNIIYVNAVATGANNGTSWANAFTDFQAGVNAASAGDSVFVAGGVYQPAANKQSFSMKEEVKIYGGFAGTEAHLSQRNLKAGDTSFLKGNGNRVINNSFNYDNYNSSIPSKILDGFVITGGTAPDGGGGILNYGRMTLINTTVSGNTAAAGGGMINYGRMTLINTTVSGNTATTYGGGIENTADLTLINTTVSGNTAGGRGGGMDNGGLIALINTTLSGNKATGQGGGIFNYGRSTITNSILFGNNSGIFEDNIPSVITYSLIQGMAADAVNHNLDGSVDPKFVNPSGGDYRLQSVSPVINHGSNDSLPAEVTTDLAGKPRISRNVVDMGAYEYQFPPIRPDANGVLYVDSAATPNGDGSSWAMALDSLNVALYAAGTINTNATKPADSVRQIWVAKGTYRPAGGQSFSMVQNVKIYGGFAGDETSLPQRDLTAGHTSILKGNGSSVVYNNNNGLTSSAVLDGFTITGGNVNSSTNPFFNGGGMYNDHTSPAISNCIFSENRAASDGGAIFNAFSSPVIVNCIFSVNKAVNVGGGIYNDNSSSSVIVNCTFWGNSAATAGGVYNENSSPVIVNCIFYDNNGGGIGNQYASRPVITYSLVGSMPADAANHNLDGSVDPKLVDPTNGNFQLKAGSPAINHGSNDPLSAGDTTDLAGNPRIFDQANGGIVDLGAYEYQHQVIALPSGKLDTATAGVPYDTVYKATGGTTPYTYSLTDGNLPAGLTLAADGTLSGTPTEAGDFTFEVTVTDQNNITQKAEETLTVNPPVLMLSPAGLASGFETVAYSQTITTSGGTAPYTYSYSTTGGETGLSEGLSLNGHTISGTPQATGTFTFTISATDNTTGKGSPFSISKEYTLIIKAAGACIALRAEPVSQTVCEETDAIFKVTATGATGYQWQSAPADGNTWSNISGATSATLTLPEVTTAQSGMQYRVRIISAHCGSLLSTPAILKVNPATAIGTQPASQTVCVGGNASFGVSASGTGLSYQWQSSTDETHWNNVSDGTSETLTLSNVQSAHNRTKYRVVVSGACTEITSNAATLSVNDITTITSQPKNTTVCAGSNTSFTAKATGTNLVYQWQSSEDGAQWQNVPDGDKPTMLLSKVTISENNMKYHVVVSGTCDHVTSKTVTLIVNPLPTLTITAGTPNPISKGSATRLTAAGAQSYHWSNSPGIQNGWENALLTIRPEQNATYTVTGVSAAGCTAQQSYSVQTVTDYKLVCNNIITPNGDNKNDTWIIQNIDSYPNNRVMIYDRAGRMIYEKENYNNQWKGMLNGGALREGTYYYIFIVDGGKKIFKGYIELLNGKQ